MPNGAGIFDRSADTIGAMPTRHGDWKAAGSGVASSAPYPSYSSIQAAGLIRINDAAPVGPAERMTRSGAGPVVAFISGLAQVNAPWGDLVDWYRELRVTQTKYGLITQVLSTLAPSPPAEPALG
jgi:hypothetical protein